MAGPLSRPLQPMEIMVLSALSVEALHGYGIVRAIERTADEQVRVRPGNLYRVIDRLLTAGLVAEGEASTEPSGGAERGRQFRITEAGLARVTHEVELFGRTISHSPRLARALRRGLEEGT